MRYHHAALGIGAGNVIAALLSWHVNHDILWAVIDFFLSWIYVIYAAVVYFHINFMGIFNSIVIAIQHFFAAL